MSEIRVLRGTVFDRLPEIPAGSIDCAVTSPPYWKLRAYLPDEHPLKVHELGQEPTPAEYIANCVRWCGLVRNCLADHGTLWVNIGDTYSSKWPCQRRNVIGNGSLEDGTRKNRPPRSAGLEDGNLCLIPQRLAIALQDDGWLVRSVVVWRKPSCMPDSITGWMWRRCRRKVKASPRSPESHKTATVLAPQSAYLCRAAKEGRIAFAAEWTACPGCKKCSPTGGYVLRRGSWRPTSSWEPVLMLAKSADYFSDGEPVKTAPASSTVERDRYTRILDDPDEQFAVEHDHETTCEDGAKLRDVWTEDLESLTKDQLIALITENADLSDVWTIPFEPLKEKHYAAYPSELVHRCLACSVSEHGYCNQCGKPFVRMVESEKSFQSGSARSGNAIAGKNGEQLQGGGDTGDIRKGPVVATRTTGWRASCKCANATPRPGRVLDPFCGSGRTGIAAARLGLDFVGVELNPEFATMAERLIKADAPLFNEVATDAA